MDDLHGEPAPYALHALDEEDERAFELHLAQCELCRIEVAALQQTAAALAYGAETPRPPPALRERILARARSSRPRVVPLRRRLALPTAAGIAAAAACAAIGLGIWASSLSGSLSSERAARR